MIRMGIIGVGRWGRNHARVVYELSRELSSDLEFTAVCDIDISRALDVAKIYGVPYAFSNLDEFVRYVDAVIIATPIDTLSDIALKVVGIGKHALIEKPGALNSRDLSVIERVATSRDVVVGVGYVMRFSHTVEFIKEFLSKFNPQFILFRRFSRRPNHLKGTSIVLDLAVHDIDLCLFLTDAESWRVELAKVFHTETDDSVIAVLNVRNIYCSIHADGVAPYKVREIDVIGTNAFVRSDSSRESVVIEWNNGSTDTLKLSGEEPLKREVRSFIEAIKFGKYGRLASPRNAINVLQIVENILDRT
ncbi:MAG: Gfo/Idh/MocA family oxidoreductase [Ignisphaera sp.]|nr:Gfo/Idh/MocA family oxidoreductase [Ignisphaera sp.]MDW8086099.1 Gfo/Idh/MocA family oxidoreductase [Ignisphaera sp.]